MNNIKSYYNLFWKNIEQYRSNRINRVDASKFFYPGIFYRDTKNDL